MTFHGFFPHRCFRRFRGRSVKALARAESSRPRVPPFESPQASQCDAAAGSFGLYYRWCCLSRSFADGFEENLVCTIRWGHQGRERWSGADVFSMPVSGRFEWNMKIETDPLPCSLCKIVAGSHETPASRDRGIALNGCRLWGGKQNPDDITQTLELPKDPHGVAIGVTRRLVFHVSPLSRIGMLSQQTRDALKAILKDNGGAPVIHIRAFVAGSGDLRRVPQIVSEVFTEKKWPLPSVSVVQAGGLPLENAQVVLEAVSVAKKEVNPDGLMSAEAQTAASLGKSQCWTARVTAWRGDGAESVVSSARSVILR